MRTSRRDFFVQTAALGLGAVTARPSWGAEFPSLARGPHLFLDNELIDRQEGLVRVVHPPERLATPVLTSARFGVTQPYLGVVDDAETGRLRLWYNRGNPVWYTESRDGVEWSDPRVAWDLKRCYGVTVLDDRGREKDPERRFKMANWQATREKEDRPGDDGGMYVGFSPDGFRWTAAPENPVLPTWPEGYGKPTHHGVGDIVDAFYDPIRKRYGCAVKVHAIPGDGFAKGPRAGDMFMRRWIGMTHSDDFVRWQKPWQIAVADAGDPGLTEFYGMGGVHARGPLLIGFARVLRDELPCDPGGPANGIGWSCLMTSRDGVRWERLREPFLDRNPGRGTWDHAMSWISAAVPRGDELLLFYGGYARGHKVEAQKERQIGLARMRRDRYASLRAGAVGGTVLTRPFVMGWSSIRVNAAVRGALRLRARDAAGAPLPGLESEPIRGDSLAHRVHWRGDARPPRGRVVRLEFELRDGDLYGFEMG
jgi:hypothetical protein